MGFVGFIGKNGRILNDNFSCYENSDASVCHLTLLNKQFKILQRVHRGTNMETVQHRIISKL